MSSSRDTSSRARSPGRGRLGWNRTTFPLRAARLAGVLALGLALPLACTSPESPSTPATAATETEARRISQRAGTLLESARDLEPGITSLLGRLAALEQAELVGLEHRFKTKESAERKLRKMLAKDPHLDIAGADTEDSLRYTWLLEDDPAGHYVAAIRRSLARLAQAGHATISVANYWPRGDSYSGVNCKLEPSSGPIWELQFQTGASLKVQRDTHGLYEQLRNPATPVAERQRIYDTMTERWESVPIPTGVLEPGALDPTERILERPRPISQGSGWSASSLAFSPTASAYFHRCGRTSFRRCPDERSPRSEVHRPQG